jgi:hypothetical protein
VELLPAVPVSLVSDSFATASSPHRADLLTRRRESAVAVLGAPNRRVQPPRLTKTLMRTAQRLRAILLATTRSQHDRVASARWTFATAHGRVRSLASAASWKAASRKRWSMRRPVDRFGGSPYARLADSIEPSGRVFLVGHALGGWRCAGDRVRRKGIAGIGRAVWGRSVGACEGGNGRAGAIRVSSERAGRPLESRVALPRCWGGGARRDAALNQSGSQETGRRCGSGEPGFSIASVRCLRRGRRVTVSGWPCCSVL